MEMETLTFICYNCAQFHRAKGWLSPRTIENNIFSDYDRHRFSVIGNGVAKEVMRRVFPEFLKADLNKKVSFYRPELFRSYFREFSIILSWPHSDMLLEGFPPLLKDTGDDFLAKEDLREVDEVLREINENLAEVDEDVNNFFYDNPMVDVFPPPRLPFDVYL